MSTLPILSDQSIQFNQSASPVNNLPTSSARLEPSMPAKYIKKGADQLSEEAAPPHRQHGGAAQHWPLYQGPGAAVRNLFT